MSLETMDPNPVWDADAYPEAVSTFERLRDDLAVSVWGADWCGDCRAVLPDFAAALDAVDIPDEQVEVVAVEKSEDGTKTGPTSSTRHRRRREFFDPLLRRSVDHIDDATRTKLESGMEVFMLASTHLLMNNRDGNTVQRGSI